MHNETTDNYVLAADKLFDRLIQADKTHIECTGCKLNGNTISLTYFYRTVKLDMADKTIVYSDDNSEVSISDKLLIIPYLLAASPDAYVKNEFVNYRGIKKAAVFEKAFINMLNPLKKEFTTLDEFKKACQNSGGEIMPYKDYSVKINAFDNIPLVYVFNEGDDEFPSNITVLYDVSFTDFIHEENVPTLGIEGLKYLIRCKNI